MQKTNKPNFIQRYFQSRASREHQAFMKAVLKDLMTQGRRSEIFNTDGLDYLRELPWDYPALYELYRNDPVTRTVGDSIIRELLRPRGANRTAFSVQPRWVRKCPSCGNEYQTEIERCTDCKHTNGKGIATIKPDLNQRQKLKAFLEDPNKDDELTDIIESVYHFMFSVGDWYISMQKASLGSFEPFTIYNEDSRYMQVACDKHGNLGNKQWFCPLDKDHPERWFPSPESFCPDHPDAALKETAYFYTDGNLRARFAADEILHGKPSAWLPSKYSYSPLITCLLIVYSMRAMNFNNFDIYDDGKLGNILCLPVEQDKATEIAQAIEKQRNIPKWDQNKGRWMMKRLKTLFVGVGKDGKAAVNVPAMPDSEKMQSLEWWKLWKTAVCAVYGVQDIYAGNSEPGTTGQNPRMKIDVNNNSLEFWGSKFEDPFNNVVVTQGLGVTDWIFKFNPLEEKDEMQDVTILSSKLDVIQKAIDLGMKAELTDEGEVKVSGQPLTLEEKQKQAMERFDKMTQQKPQGNASPQVFEGKQPFKKEEVFATEKGHRVKYLVERVTEK
jgi:hypothetical protein